MSISRVAAIGPIALCALMGAPRSSAQAPCEPHWLDLFPPGDFDNPISAMLLFDDDGPGPALSQLCVGGSFTLAGGQPASLLARWDGVAWSPMVTTGGGSVDCMSAFDEDADGPNPARLFIGGRFSQLGGLVTEGIARWDGSTWTDVAGGIDGSAPAVNALTVFDPDGDGPSTPVLVAAGRFTSAGGMSASNIAQWDGTAWAPLASGTAGQVTATCMYDSDGGGPLQPLLIAAGFFNAAGGVPAQHIAAWDGATWSPLGAGVDGTPYSLASFDPDGPGPDTPRLIVAGYFYEGGVPIAGPMQWDGSTWAALGGDQYVDLVTVFDVDGAGPTLPALYGICAGGATRFVGRWDGAEWAIIGEANSFIDSMYAPRPDESPVPTLYIGGLFSVVDGVDADAIAAWDGASWTALGAQLPDLGTDYGVRDLAVFDEDGDGPNPRALFVAHDFLRAGPTFTGGLSRWDGAAWTALQPDTLGAEKLFVLDPDGPGAVAPALYISLLLGPTRYSLERWDGAELSLIGTQFDRPAYALCFFDEDGDGPSPPTLFAGGGFTSIDGVPASRIARLNGSQWEPVGDGVSGLGDAIVRALAVFDEDDAGPAPPALYVAGRFTSAGGIPVVNIARWDGAAWSAVGAGLGTSTGSVNTLGVYDLPNVGPTLLAGGHFDDPYAEWGGVARWDGMSWAAVGALSRYSSIYGLTLLDADGCGPGEPELYACGQLSQSDGGWSSRIAKWDGTEWMPVAGTEPPVSLVIAMAVQSSATTAAPRLYVGGPFGSVGGYRAGHLAALEGCAPLPGDLNCDGLVDTFDIDPFVLALTDPTGYAATFTRCSSLLADCNDDGLVNAFDIDPFVEILVGG
jgi:trimeric autotransporter adhesin